jgi:hypothetical protein
LLLLLFVGGGRRKFLIGIWETFQIAGRVEDRLKVLVLKKALNNFVNI